MVYLAHRLACLPVVRDAERFTPMDFSQFDQRNYRTLPVQEGYSEWAARYEETPLEAMDTKLLDRLSGVEWNRIDRAVDLACGTERIGAWLKGHDVRSIDGVDFTRQML